MPEIRVEVSADMQFIGQTHLLRVALPSARVSRDELRALFEAAYHARFRVELSQIRANLVNLNCSVIGRRDEIDLGLLIDRAGRRASLAEARPASGRCGSTAGATPRSTGATICRPIWT